jgi:hypothetical protein
MPPLTRARKKTLEETMVVILGRFFAYLSYSVRQFIILFPSLWAGYERRRRRKDEMGKVGKNVAAIQLIPGLLADAVSPISDEECALSLFDRTGLEESFEEFVKLVELSEDN